MVREIGNKGEGGGEKGRGKRNCPRETKNCLRIEKRHIGKWWFLKVK